MDYDENIGVWDLNVYQECFSQVSEELFSQIIDGTLPNFL